MVHMCSVERALKAEMENWEVELAEYEDGSFGFCLFSSDWEEGAGAVR